MDVMEERILSISLFPSYRFYHIKCCKIPLASEMCSCRMRRQHGG